MEYILNSTKAYHTESLNTLGWELTVSNSLEPEDTLLRKLLVRNDSYGHLVYDFLTEIMPLHKIRRVIEIGGGYGFLMRDFVDRNNLLEPLMLDISPYLLEKQKETLRDCAASFREADFLDIDPKELEEFELAIMNENLGDFPTLIGLDFHGLNSGSGHDDPVLEKVRWLFDVYSFDRPDRDTFNLNMGAIEALEKLCLAKIPYIFLTEHSCEAAIPEGLERYIDITSSGDPERIRLKGHDEYSIKFSYLQKVAQVHGYQSSRGPMADFIRFNMTDEVKAALRSGGRASDNAEIICQFIEDLYKYEYLLLSNMR